ncbi:MAG TPA: YggT family protein, partial [Chloroflexota bacterium]|nr:YggT family protein [Chloroflexota bacterium]
EHLISLIFGCIEVLIGIRVVLHLIGANAANPFASFVYGVSSFFLAPFFGLVGSPAAGRYVLEIPSLVAIVVYALIAWGLVTLLQTFAVQATTRTYSSYDRFRT